MAIILKKAKDVGTAPLVVTGLIGDWLTAYETGIRPLDGAILGAIGACVARTRSAKTGALGVIGLTAAYFDAFGLSHPPTKKIGT